MTDEIDERTVKAEQGSAQQSNHLSDAKKSFLGGDGGAATFAKLALSKNIEVPAYKSPVKNQSVVAHAPKTLDADSSRLGIYGKDNPMADLKKEVSAVLKLHTRQAEQLWIGRKGDKATKVYPIWGLIQFASEIGKVWHEASLNNPVADFFLVKAEAEYEKTRKIIDSRLDELSSIIDDNDAFEEITLAENRQPIAHNLVFLCPWGYHGAGLLKKFDDIVCKAITARHVGFIDNESWQIYVHDSSRALRHFYRCCESFVDIPLERDWFTANDKKL
jgi:integrating conjugative element protein (TIGR03761 family)